ncbi:MAG: MOSC domain-containing protein [candidate division Zixibacteria bacterium]|nr:MOSC domain-containing protein [candidate division Zixibacteria bacterium]
MSTSGTIYKISVSASKGTKKKNTSAAMMIADSGIEGDAHAGSERQVSLLPFESFSKLDNDTLVISPGDFAENITTQGLDFSGVALGKRLRIGKAIELEITQIGKECHHGCEIRKIVGDCIMPREGIFARVINGGDFKTGDTIEWQ